jgi:hypothetical protein
VHIRRRDLTLAILSEYTPEERFVLADFLERFTVAMDNAVKARKRRGR